LKSRFKKTSDLDGGRYSRSMRRKPNYPSKKPYFSKRSASMS